MSSKHEPPAFPSRLLRFTEQGLTKREFVAAQCMAEIAGRLYSRGVREPDQVATHAMRIRPDVIAKHSFELADAFLCASALKPIKEPS